MGRKVLSPPRTSARIYSASGETPTMVIVLWMSLDEVEDLGGLASKW